LITELNLLDKRLQAKNNHFLNYKKAVEEADINFVGQNTKMKNA